MVVKKVYECYSCNNCNNKVLLGVLMVNRNLGLWYLNLNIIFNKFVINLLSKNFYILDIRIECFNIVEIVFYLIEINMYKIVWLINFFKVFMVFYFICSLSLIVGIVRGCIKRYR